MIRKAKGLMADFKYIGKYAYTKLAARTYATNITPVRAEVSERARGHVGEASTCFLFCFGMHEKHHLARITAGKGNGPKTTACQLYVFFVLMFVPNDQLNPYFDVM